MRAGEAPATTAMQGVERREATPTPTPKDQPKQSEKTSSSAAIAVPIVLLLALIGGAAYAWTNNLI